jgi:hypothetical protein
VKSPEANPPEAKVTPVKMPTSVNSDARTLVLLLLIASYKYALPL